MTIQPVIYTHFLIEDKVLRNIGKTIVKCECALIEIIGISIHFSSLKKCRSFKLLV